MCRGGWERRHFNLAFFKRLLIDDDCAVTGELAEPFDVLLGEDLRRAIIAQESEELTESIEEAQRRRAIEFWRLICSTSGNQRSSSAIGSLSAIASGK